MEINILARRHAAAAAWTLLGTANALAIMVMHRESPNPGLRDLDALHFELIAFGVGREELVEIIPCDRFQLLWGRRSPPPRAVFSNLCLSLLQPDAARLGTWACEIHG